MPQDKTFDSGKVVIPVAHPSGDIHQIEVPRDMSLADLHAAALDAGYAHQFPSPGPTREGVIENSPKFKAKAEEAFSKVGYGSPFSKAEAGFIVRNGVYSPVKVQADPKGENGGEMSFETYPGDMVVHTHSLPYQQSPSDNDKATAKKTPVYTITQDGLWYSDRNGTTQVYKDPKWYKQNNK